MNTEKRKRDVDTKSKKLDESIKPRREKFVRHKEKLEKEKRGQREAENQSNEFSPDGQNESISTDKLAVTKDLQQLVCVVGLCFCIGK